MDNLTQFLSGLNSEESIYFLAFIVGGFLLGALFGAALRGIAVRRLKNQLEKKNEETIDLQGQLSELTQKFSLKESELRNLAEERDEYVSKVSTLEKDNSRLQKTVFQLNNEYDKLKSSGQSFESTFDELNNQIVGYQTQVQQLKKELAEALEEKEYAEQKLASLANAGITNGQSQGPKPPEHAAAEQALEKERLDSLEQKLEQLIKVNTTLHQEIDKLKAGNAAMQIAASSNTSLTAAVEPKPEVKLKQPQDDPYYPEDAADLPSEQPYTPDDSQVGEIMDMQEDKSLFADKGVVEVAPATEKDNLTLIEGIGPFIEQKLNGIGIFSYEQISKFNDQKIEEVTRAIQFFEGRIKKDNWVGQAMSLYQIKLQNPEAFNTELEKNQFLAGAPEALDDLKLIEGIGPKIEKLLKDAGFLSLADIAVTTAADLKNILDKGGEQYRMHDPNTWPAQARLAVSGDWDLLEEYQQKLRGGKDS